MVRMSDEEKWSCIKALFIEYIEQMSKGLFYHGIVYGKLSDNFEYYMEHYN